jgi:hypothetical protein
VNRAADDARVLPLPMEAGPESRRPPRRVIGVRGGRFRASLRETEQTLSTREGRGRHPLEILLARLRGLLRRRAQGWYWTDRRRARIWL